MFDDLFSVLSRKRLLKSSGESLSQRELLKLWEFYNLIRGGGYSKLIMRGESDENLNRQFFVDTKDPVFLAEFLFMTGEKARFCWTEKFFVDPENTSIENFERILKSLSHYIHDGRRGMGTRAGRLNEFVERNTAFCSALEDIPKIASAYRTLSDRDKIVANLNYLSISHTINSLKYKDASGLVSATTEPRVAARFAADAMIYGWVPKNARKGRSRGRTIDYVAACSDETLKRMGLPYPETAVYPEQREVSVRCGLLPHFIIGFTVGDAFYVNPAIFSTIDRMHELRSFRELSRFKRDLQLYGMDVNQEHFFDFLRRTGYRRYVTFDGDEYVIHHVD